MINSYPECESLSTPQQRRICRNEAGLPLNGKNSTNAYRLHWGFRVIPDQEGRSTREPSKKKPNPQKKPNQAPGWGDRVSSALAAVGVTEDRVSAWLGRPCGCKARRERLNRLGEWAANILGGKGGSIDDVLKS